MEALHNHNAFADNHAAESRAGQQAGVCHGGLLWRTASDCKDSRQRRVASACMDAAFKDAGYGNELAGKNMPALRHDT